MQVLFWLLSLSIIQAPPDRFIVIDMNLTQPANEEADFTIDNYFKRKFPIKSGDIKSVIAAADKAAKLLDSKKTFTIDTLLNGQTTFIICANDDEFKTVSARLITVLEGSNISFAFELLRKEDDRRKAQRKLLDFAAYLQN